MNPIFPVLLSIGLLLCVLGLWGKKQMVSVIAGSSTQKCFDPVGLAWWVGRNVFLMGLAAVALAFLALVAKLVFAIVVMYTLVLLIGFIITFIGCRRYEH